MVDINKDLEGLSKSLASVSVTDAFKKYGIDKNNGVNELSDSQKQELRNMADNLQSMVNQFVAQQKDPSSSSDSKEEKKKKEKSKESPLREFLNRKNEKEVDG
ncbi:hypothetical protein SAMN05421676_107136 [Salinibacillus kushneri]|uniref:Spore coat protein W n=1 Tax=Salinibacillus kushneri TaxID=237682 RepID=A0A1I0GRT6_9BACI|nr:hypothetical protein [Salinibacillus kushneri]SET73856.1 hypothetical protein SAMN05421676_107136 [Salinibacillus kushneri]